MYMNRTSPIHTNYYTRKPRISAAMILSFYVRYSVGYNHPVHYSMYREPLEKEVPLRCIS